jgi:nucleotide-binding universal stress UspA family protein
MKNVIIPIDFSDTSFNAARYAAQMLAGRKDMNVILYHMFEDEEDAGTTATYLESLKKELKGKGVANIEWVKEQGDDLIDSLSRLAYQKASAFIIMGITGKSAIAQVLVGSNTLKIAKENVCPVLIVPSDASFRGIKNVAFASDFENVELGPSATHLKQFLEVFKPNLHVVNVNSEQYISLTEEYEEKKATLKSILSEYNPVFHFIRLYNVEDAINQFVEDKNIDVIITVPHYHSLWSQIFGSHTKKLAYQSHVPVLAIHE